MLFCPVLFRALVPMKMLSFPAPMRGRRYSEPALRPIAMLLDPRAARNAP